MAWGGAYSYIPLYSEWSALGTGCQYDPQCWADTITTCEGLIEELIILDVGNTIIDPLYERLQETEAHW